jgi:hypothetical protein
VPYAQYAQNVSWSGIINKPTNLSQFNNDLNFSNPFNQVLNTTSDVKFSSLNIANRTGVNDRYLSFSTDGSSTTSLFIDNQSGLYYLGLNDVLTFGIMDSLDVDGLISTFNKSGLTMHNGDIYLSNDGIGLSTLKKFWYNQSDSIYHYNMSIGIGTYNSTYDSLRQWGYNHTQTSNTSIVNTYGKWFYNQTYSGSTYNSTYDSLNSTYNKFWYNQSGAYNSSYDALIKWGYNQTYSGSTYNATYIGINTSYNKFWYNYTSVASDIKWGYNMTISYNSTYDGYNTTYGKYWYNQTYSGSTYNSTYDSLNTSYNKWWYNMSGASGGTYNSSYDNLLKYGYNFTTAQIYNATYDKWAYNMTSSSSGSYNATYEGYNTSYNKFWYNQTYSGSTYNDTYKNLLAQNCPSGYVMNGTLANGSIQCKLDATSAGGMDYTNVVLSNTSNTFSVGQNISMGSGGWFKGLFSWVIDTASSSFLTFNGSTLSINVFNLVNTHTHSINNVTGIPNCGAGQFLTNDTGSVRCATPTAGAVSDDSIKIKMQNVTNFPSCGANEVITNRTGILTCVTDQTGGASTSIDDLEVNLSQGVVLYEQFLSNSAIETGELGSLGWNYAGTVTSNTAPYSGNHPGTVKLSTGTLATTNSSIDLGLSTMMIDTTSGNISWCYLVNISHPSTNAENYTFYIGLHDATPTTVIPTDMLGFYANTSNPNISIMQRANNVMYTNETRVAVNGSWTKLCANHLNVSGRYQNYYYVNNVLVTTYNETNMPFGSARSFGNSILLKKSGGTTARTIDVDYLYYKQLFAVSR